MASLKRKPTPKTKDHRALYMETVTAVIQKTEHLNHEVIQVFLELPDNSNIPFCSGQYLECHIDDNISAFSIANADTKNNIIELHIRDTPNEETPSTTYHYFLKSKTVKITLPKGNCVYNSNEKKPVLFICGSTGFAQMKSMLEEAFSKKVNQPLYLYWGAQIAADLYMHELPEMWEQQYQNFKYVPVISNPTDQAPGNKAEPWTGRKGFVHHAVMEDFGTLKDIQVYVSGSPGMVYAIYDDFIKHGLNKGCMSADVFDYAPRE